MSQKDTMSLQCINYILEHESEDYVDFCSENDLYPKDVHNSENQKHIFACACLAYENETGLKIEFENLN
jgi:hypothetical protein